MTDTAEIAPAFDTGPDGWRSWLEARPAAWAHRSAQPPWYGRTATHRVMSAERENTRDRRLARLIEDSAAGRPDGPLAHR